MIKQKWKFKEEFKNTKQIAGVMKRTLLERFQDIFKYMNKRDEAIFKSDFQEIGINPSSAENYLSIIEFIQKQPKIKVTRVKNTTVVEISEKN